MAGFNPRHDQFDGSHGYIPDATSTWQSMGPGGEAMPFESMAHHSNLFPADPAHFHHHHGLPPVNYPRPESHWEEHQPAFVTDATSTQFAAYPSEPVIKAEKTLPSPTETTAPPHDESSNGAEASQAVVAATSPRSETGWLSVSSSDHTEKAPAPASAFQPDQIPFFVDNPPRLRPDGVRKKNARFEIPEERRVDTIDSLIKAADPKNERLMKELKQQKRLLRNRQAA